MSVCGQGKFLCGEVMKVSYIVTVYNKALYLPFVIRGLAAQEGEFEREFIFVDDGSTDDSVKIVGELKETLPGRVEIIEQDNSGPSVATNKGFEISTGDIIKFVDGDDVLMPWTTKLLSDILREGGHAYVFGIDPIPIDFDADVARKIDHIVACARPQIEDLEPQVWREPLEFVINRAHMNPTAWVATRDAVVKTGGCADHIFIQDYILELCLAAQGSAGIWPGPVFVYPRSDPNRNTANKAQILHDLNLALAEFFCRQPEHLAEYGFRAAKRATGRAWKFAHRNRVPLSVRSKALSQYLGVRAGMVRPSIDLLEATGQAFKQGFTIR